MSEKESLNKHDWRRLARTVQTGNCILVLGPGVAVNPHDGERTPLTTLLARSLSERLGPDSQIVNPDDLTHVSQVFLHQPKWDRLELEFVIDDFYKKYVEDTTPLHMELAELPFTFCVTTTPDHFLTNAFKRAGKTPICEHYHFRKNRNLTLPEPDATHPMVYGLYGDTSDLSSLILSESDLLEFLVNVIAKTPPLPSFLTAKFSDPDVSFLFLGFGFDQWYVRILLHVLQAQGHRAKSLALEGPSFFEQPSQREVAVFFEREHLIAFRLLSWEGFVKELKQHHDAMVGEGISATLPPPSDAPQLFLCHAHEDKDAVVKISQELQNLGLRVWLDQHSLRGGDDWDKRIPEIMEEVDYVVVIQSPHMQRRVESYVYKEVRIALERQQHFASGYRFIIPTILEPCDGLDELRHLQFVDLSKGGGTKELVNAVTEDWTRRHAAPEFDNS